MQRSLYQSKVTFSLTAIQRPGVDKKDLYNVQTQNSPIALRLTIVS